MSGDADDTSAAAGGDTIGPDAARLPIARYVAAREAVAPREFPLGESRIVLYEVDELAEAQIGYGTGAEDEDITGEEPGQWRPLWLVIGEEESLQDTLLVDLADERLPVLVAAEDAVGWSPELVAESFPAFTALLGELSEAAAVNAEALLERAKARTPAQSHSTWQTWLTA